MATTVEYVGCCGNGGGGSISPWLVKVSEVPDVSFTDLDHAYLLPDGSLWIQNFDGTDMIKVNGTGGSGGDMILTSPDNTITLKRTATGYELSVSKEITDDISSLKTKTEEQDATISQNKSDISNLKDKDSEQDTKLAELKGVQDDMYARIDTNKANIKELQDKDIAQDALIGKNADDISNLDASVIKEIDSPDNSVTVTRTGNKVSLKVEKSEGVTTTVSSPKGTVEVTKNGNDYELEVSKAITDDISNIKLKDEEQDVKIGHNRSNIDTINSEIEQIGIDQETQDKKIDQNTLDIDSLKKKTVSSKDNSLTITVDGDNTDFSVNFKPNAEFADKIRFEQASDKFHADVYVNDKLIASDIEITNMSQSENIDREDPFKNVWGIEFPAASTKQEEFEMYFTDLDSNYLTKGNSVAVIVAEGLKMIQLLGNDVIHNGYTIAPFLSFTKSLGTLVLNFDYVKFGNSVGNVLTTDNSITIKKDGGLNTLSVDWTKNPNKPKKITSNDKSIKITETATEIDLSVQPKDDNVYADVIEYRKVPATDTQPAKYEVYLNGNKIVDNATIINYTEPTINFDNFLNTTFPATNRDGTFTTQPYGWGQDRTLQTLVSGSSVYLVEKKSVAGIISTDNSISITDKGAGVFDIKNNAVGSGHSARVTNGSTSGKYDVYYDGIKVRTNITGKNLYYMTRDVLGQDLPAYKENSGTIRISPTMYQTSGVLGGDYIASWWIDSTTITEKYAKFTLI